MKGMRKNNMNYLLVGIIVIIGLSGLRGLSEGFVRTTFRLLLNLVVLGISIFLTPILVRTFFQSLLRDGTDALQQIPFLLILFALLKFGAKFIVSSVDLIAKLPVIRNLNRLLGFIAGLAQGLLVVWAVFLAAEFLSTTNFGIWINTTSQMNEYTKFLYDNNLLRDIIVSYFPQIVNSCSFMQV